MRNFNILFLGDGYKGKGGTVLFSQDVASGIKAFSATEPFAGNIGKIKFYSKISKQNLGCDDSAGFNEGVSCNVQKIIDATNEVIIPCDVAIVFMNGKGHGGSDGSKIAVVGLGNHTRNEFCTFEQAAFYGKMLHEVGHLFVGMGHLEGTKMGSCTNGCCEIWNKPFNSEQQAIITNRINVAINS